MIKSPRQIAWLAIPMFLLIPSSSRCWRVIDYHRVESGVKFLAASQNLIWINRPEQDSLIQAINPENGEVVQTISGPEFPCKGLDVNESGLLYLTNRGIYLLNFNGQVLRRYDLERGELWGVASTDSGFWTIDVSRRPFRALRITFPREERDNFALPNNQLGDLSRWGNSLWVSDPGNSWIYQISIAQRRVVEVYPSPRYYPTALAVRDSLVYLIDQGDDEENEFLYIIDLRGAPAPRLIPSNERINFGLVVFTSPATLPLTLYNIGNDTLHIDSIRLSLRNQGFRLGQLPGLLRILPGGYLIVNITFTPQEYAPYRDTLRIFSDDPYRRVLSIPLWGHGLWSQRRLGVYPDTLNFGSVRADPSRDGSRRRWAALFNEGNDLLQIEQAFLRLHNIFRIELPPLPLSLEPAETLWVPITFIPTRPITYLDTLILRTNDQWRYAYIYLVGRGDDSVYTSGTVLWSYQRDIDPIRCLQIVGDIDGDHIPEVAMVTARGKVFLINGFSSGEGDVYWERNLEWEEENFVGNNSSYLIGEITLNRDELPDLIIGAPYLGKLFGFDGAHGEILWIWEPPPDEQPLHLRTIQKGGDLNGDGYTDPYALFTNDTTTLLVRLEGTSGQPIWHIRESVTLPYLAPTSDLTEDGVEDVVAVAPVGRVYGYSGVNGQRIFRFNTPPFDAYTLVSNQNNPRSALVLATESDLRCYSLIAPGELLWQRSYNYLGLNEGDRIHLLYNPLEDPQVRDQRLIFASTTGSVGVFSLDSLQVPIIYHQEEEISILSVLPAVRNIYPPLATVALASGRIESFPIDQRALQPLWVFQRFHSQPIQLLPFADVDRGGAIDLLALFSDGWAGVISSGGDLQVHPLKFPLPTNDFTSSIYPQPFNSQSVLYMNIPPGIVGPLTVHLYDLSGRVLEKAFIPVSQGRIILPNLFPLNAPTGQYFISFQSQDGRRWLLSGTLIR